MTPFTTLTSPATPFFRDGIGTDIIYAGPRADLQTGIVEHNIFKHFRFDEGGRARPESLFDKPPFDQSAILIVGRGFGRGKSPDAAARAIAELGIVCVVGVSFAPAFEQNAIDVGVLPLKLDYHTVTDLVDQASTGDAMTIDLPAGKIITYHGDRITFEANEPLRTAMHASAKTLSKTRSKAALKSRPQKSLQENHLFFGTPRFG